MCSVSGCDGPVAVGAAAAWRQRLACGSVAGEDEINRGRPHLCDSLGLHLHARQPRVEEAREEHKVTHDDEREHNGLQDRGDCHAADRTDTRTGEARGERRRQYKRSSSSLTGCAREGAAFARCLPAASASSRRNEGKQAASLCALRT